MRMKAIVGAMIATVLGAPVWAADACLRNDRIYSMKVVDSSTILVTNRDKTEYTVHLRGVCIGLNETAQYLTFRRQTDLGCLRSGDSVGYSMPGERPRISLHGSTQTTCYVDSVSEGTPPQNPG